MRLKVVVVDVPEGVEIGPLPVEELDHPHARDPLVQEGVDPCQTDADVPVRLSNPGAEEEGRHEDEGQYAERHERQLPVHAQHGGHDEDQREDVAEDGDDPRAEQLVEGLDVARNPRDEAARGIAVVEAQVQALEVSEELGSQIVHDALTQPGREQALPVLERETGQHGADEG